MNQTGLVQRALVLAHFPKLAAAMPQMVNTFPQPNFAQLAPVRGGGAGWGGLKVVNTFPRPNQPAVVPPPKPANAVPMPAPKSTMPAAPAPATGAAPSAPSAPGGVKSAGLKQVDLAERAIVLCATLLQ